MSCLRREEAFSTPTSSANARRSAGLLALSSERCIGSWTRSDAWEIAGMSPRARQARRRPHMARDRFARLGAGTGATGEIPWRKEDRWTAPGAKRPAPLAGSGRNLWSPGHPVNRGDGPGREEFQLRGATGGRRRRGGNGDGALRHAAGRTACRPAVADPVWIPVSRAAATPPLAQIPFASPMTGHRQASAVSGIHDPMIRSAPEPRSDSLTMRQPARCACWRPARSAAGRAPGRMDQCYDDEAEHLPVPPPRLPSTMPG